MDIGFGQRPYRGRGRGRPPRGRGRGLDLTGREGDAGVEFVPRPPGVRRLQEWLALDADSVVNVLGNSRNGFAQLLKSEMQAEGMRLAIALLAKACESDFQVNKTELLAGACSPGFQGRLALYLNSLHKKDSPVGRKDFDKLFSEILVFCETAVALLPVTAAERLGGTLTFLSVAMDNVETIPGFYLAETLRARLAKLQDRLKAVLEERSKIEVARRETARSEQQRVLPPPDNFRDLPVFPCATELTAQHRPFLRPHIVDGAYQSAEHYLDVQFRLLREDFMQPLREGICALAAGDPRGAGNVRVYEEVWFGDRLISRSDKVGIVVHFPWEGEIDWEQSKRMMFGALLCFSRDNFASLIFATVLERNIDDLKDGRVVVEMVTPSSEDLIERYQLYTMVEAEVFFAPYHHVLLGLQAMPSIGFPMSRYIVEVAPEIVAPHYLRLQPKRTYDIDDGVRKFLVQPLEDGSWPGTTSLNPSQYAAFEAALTREFVVIQGPPGTGKTHVGLLIARNLINNLLQSWYEYDDWNYDSDEETFLQFSKRTRARRGSPMLVVCYTNHALDQFLEGLLGTTDRIVRVGGRSKSERLEEYNLNNIRWMERSKEKKGNPHCLMMSTIQRYISALLDRMRTLQRKLVDLEAPRGIVSARSLATSCNCDNFDMFCNEYGEIDDDYFVDWLLCRHGAPAPQDEDPGAAESLDPDLVPDDVHLAPDKDRSSQEGENLSDVDKFDVEYAVLPMHMEQEIANLNDSIKEKENNPVVDGLGVHVPLWDLRQQLAILQPLHQELSNWLAAQKPPEAEINRMEQLLAKPGVALWDLTAEQRRACYACWLRSLRRKLSAWLDALEVEFRHETRRHEETRQMADLSILSRAVVIGMTTTMAAKLQPLLVALRAKIVIVEEAAEVTESHIVVSLSEHCEHLILIGDHQQLRPSTASYRMAREFHLDVSLFERMVRNGVHCARLAVQHRMRPEVARLVSPSIYPDLANHESVTRLPAVRGVRHSLYFFTHANREHAVNETSSKRNAFEGDMVLGFCRYLLQQGYDPKKITVLATYSGQMFYLKEKCKEFPTLQEVLITIVDKYQGEENDIILLSLVRNNEEQSIGFLSITNRVCVALSRAKQGLFIFGNMELLAARSEIWPKVKVALEEQDALGNRLQLRCEKHPDQITEIGIPADFLKVPEGGCQLLCDTIMPCGHRCPKQCHAEDREHLVFQCLEPCERVPTECPSAHPCTRLCHETCGACVTPIDHTPACGHEVTMLCHEDPKKFLCPQPVPAKDLPCGHTFQVPCHVKPEEQHCPAPCNFLLDCGHSCDLKCHVLDDPDHVAYKCQLPCTKNNFGCTEHHPCLLKCHETCVKCTEKVVKVLPACLHKVKTMCCTPTESIVCPRICERILPCQHHCLLMCSVPCGGCRLQVEKVVADCQHTVLTQCSTEPTRSDCRESCQRTLACGHPCQRLCCLPCTDGKDCNVPGDTPTKLGCGHEVILPCKVTALGLPADSEELLSRCTTPCGGVLSCGHPCAGTCGECRQGRTHVRCNKQCGRVLVCGHECKAGCADMCPPCSSPCAKRCPHSRCGKLCGVPCTPCKMRCSRRCQHAACGRRCDAECGVDPCSEPCPQQLSCGHACMGFCGEPCPPLCRECRPKKAGEILFGDEAKLDARFVLLTDCRHSIEAGGLERWLKQGGAEVRVPQCPRCKRNIVTTQRFKGLVQTALNDIMNIKKSFGDRKENEKPRKALLSSLILMRLPKERLPSGDRGLELRKSNPKECQIFCSLTKEEELLLKTLVNRLTTLNKNRKFYLSSVDLENLRVKTEILIEVHESLKSLKTLEGSSLEERAALATRATRLLQSVRERNQLGADEVAVIGLEIRLLQRLDQVIQISDIVRGLDKGAELDCAKVCKKLLAFCTYSLEDDVEIEVELKPLVKKWLGEFVIRKMVKKARDLGRGRWFKCPNGHYFVIDDCARAGEKGCCPDCGATIPLATLSP